MAQPSTERTAAYRPEMDERTHEETYAGFAHATLIGTIAVAAVVAALAVGGVKGAWLSSLAMILLTLIATGIGFVSTSVSWRAPGAVLGLLLLMLLFY